MADVYGEGDFQYTFVEDWMKLPDGMRLLEWAQEWRWTGRTGCSS